MRGLAIGALTLALTTMAPGASAASKSSADRLVDALVACHALPDDAQKLACYEKHVADLTQLREKSGSLVAARDKPPAFATIEATLQSVSDFQNGHWLLVLSNHSVWETQGIIYADPRQGEPVKITKGPLGSFDAVIGNQRSVKVRPLR